MASDEEPFALDDDLRSAIERHFDSGLAKAKRLGGGDINEAFSIEFGGGKKAFLKTNADAPRDMFPAEARGLAWLAEGKALRVPEVLGVSEEVDEGPCYLVLELLEPGARRKTWGEDFGRALAYLHRSGAPGFGLDHDNFIGRLPQNNTPCATWPEFYVLRRLEPQLRRAVDGSNASMTMKSGFAKLFARMESRVGDPEPPARLHGDLWNGNVHTDEAGHACLIDPAVYGGCREMDLAMMALFGGFGEPVFRSYDEIHPRAEGADERVPLYQLYPLLVHVNLFGHSYVDAVERELRKML